MDDLRRGYDAVARDYAAHVFDELAGKPFDRALLDRFADLARPLGRVCDLGCGPGHVARYLHTRGLDVVGVDLSPAMVEEAKRLVPEVTFAVGSMLALPFARGTLGGIAALYSIIHVPRPQLDRAFGEMWRTLAPGAPLLVSFHTGGEDRHLDEWWGHPVSIDFLFFDRAEVENRMWQAGFVDIEGMERDPYPGVEVETRRAYVVARKAP